jgi:long-subunit fatty acid transport protein
MKFLFFAFALVLALPAARAGLGSTYGFGSSTASLAGSNRSWAYDGFALDRSPSLMSEMTPVTSYGFLGAKSEFSKIGGIQVDNDFVGGSSKTGDVDTEVPDTFDFLFGGIWALGKSERNYRVGVTFSTPVDKLTEPSTNDPYQPQYYGYAYDTQRLSLSAGLSGMVSESLSVGAGIDSYLVQAATAQSRLPSDTGNGRTTTGNLKMDVKPAMGPVAGATFSDDKTNFLTLYWAGARDARLKVKNDSLIGVIGVTPLSFDSEVSIFYDPEVWSLGYARVASSWDFFASVDYELWSRYDGGYMRASFRTFQGTFRQYPVDLEFHNILIPKIGVNHKWGDGDMRFGLAYRPSTHPDSEQDTNYIEPDRWVAGVGYGFDSDIFGLLEGKVRVDTHFQTHYLVPKRVVKKQSSSNIGAPGYDTGGYVFCYGIDLSVGI